MFLGHFGVALAAKKAAPKASLGVLVLAAQLALVPSHWILDYIAHRPDLPIVPGGERYGLGMWNSLPVTLIVEFALFGAGIAVYLSTTSAKDRAGQYPLWSLLIFLILAYLGSIFGPPPPSVRVLALGALGIWLAIPWMAWADRHLSLV